MPRFFDDYSNTYLTHDSSAGRKQQRRGWKFRENFRLHYQQYIQQWRRGEMGLASAQQSYIRSRGKDDQLIPPLPAGWKECIDNVTSITYYVDTKTGKRTWVRPGFIPPPPGQGPPGTMNRPPPLHPHHPPQQPPQFQQQQPPHLPQQPRPGGGGPPLPSHSLLPPPGGPMPAIIHLCVVRRCNPILLI